jgi:LmbE family N-acetylglucosaminyl deacetylase
MPAILPDNLAMGRSLLLVHAHPDDESIATGATMASYAAEGTRVTGSSAAPAGGATPG